MTRRARGLSLSVTATGAPSMAKWAMSPSRFLAGPGLGLARKRKIMSERPRFHLAFPVRDLAEARAFYGGLLGCPEGRSSEDWVDFDFHGHQIVTHLAPEGGPASTNP